MDHRDQHCSVRMDAALLRLMEHYTLKCQDSGAAAVARAVVAAAAVAVVILVAVGGCSSSQQMVDNRVCVLRIDCMQRVAHSTLPTVHVAKFKGHSARDVLNITQHVCNLVGHGVFRK
jgi:hypothetical protein